MFGMEVMFIIVSGFSLKSGNLEQTKIGTGFGFDLFLLLNDSPAHLWYQSPLY